MGLHSSEGACSTPGLQIAAERKGTMTSQESTISVGLSLRDVLIGGAAMVAAAALPVTIAARAQTSFSTSTN
jgi:hypothetical protein